MPRFIWAHPTGGLGIWHRGVEFMLTKLLGYRTRAGLRNKLVLVLISRGYPPRIITIIII